MHPPKYTPIIIQYLPGAVFESGNVLQAQPLLDWAVRIIPPASSTASLYQSLPEPITFKIPGDGKLRLKLLPSDYYVPKGRYIVKFFKKGRKQAVLEQTWVVPFPPIYQTFKVTVTDTGTFLPTNANIYEIISSSLATPFSIGQEGEVVWEGTAPTLDSEITFVVQPAVTLADLLEEDTIHKRGSYQYL